MKFQELCALVGGFLKIILLIGEFFSFLVNNSYMNELFCFDDNESSFKLQKK